MFELFEVTLFGGWAGETDAVQSLRKLSEDEWCWSAEYECCQRSGALLRRAAVPNRGGYDVKLARLFRIKAPALWASSQSARL